ncbi:MAG: rhodoquinone biosynthesis methyltransferase RquA [Pseudomonadota bacterium]|nr:rhodoquinone biosynthesis methyltransferase RquA [Pseudomonadota bacterium]
MPPPPVSHASSLPNTPLPGAGLPLPEPARASSGAGVPATPDYLHDTYSWAYVTPEAVRRFERQWLVNLILWGNFPRLRDMALEAFGQRLEGRSLQVACVYGDLTACFAARHARASQLDVVDVLPVQIDNLRRKLGAGSGVNLRLADSAALPQADGSYDRVLLYFLLHEQPLHVRVPTVSEALRVLRPGGKLVLVDYHRPSAWHPLRLPMAGVLRTLEPFALDLWRTEIADWLPADVPLAEYRKRTCFGGLYQIIEITKAGADTARQEA